jgi:hypothetical protein
MTTLHEGAMILIIWGKCLGDDVPVQLNLSCKFHLGVNDCFYPVVQGKMLYVDLVQPT